MYHAVSPRSSSKLVKHLPKAVLDSIDGQAKVVSGIQGLCETLWEKSADLVQEALQTGYIQGIQKGTLSPVDYGGYTVQDAVYCSNATDNLQKVAEKSTGDVKKFIEAREKSYEEYTNDLFKQWYISDPTGIQMGKAAADYSNYETHVATTLDPLYFLVAMVPCDRLWNWLANQIKDGETKENLYSFWITENSSGSGGATLQNFIDARAQELDEGKALEVYRKCMQGEVNFFKSATGAHN